MKPRIKVIDSVHCKANKEARKIILPFLKYEKEVRNRNKFSKERYKFETGHLITGRKGSSGHFYTGLLPLIKKNIKKQKINIEIDDSEIEILKPTNKIPTLDGITFRKDQLKACKKANKYQRGRIVFPTGSGKTIIALGIISMYKDYKTLFLVHTLELLKQTCDELEKYNFKYQICGGKNKKPIDWENLGGSVLVSTIQSFAKLPWKKWFHVFDVTIIDEGHHVNKESSQYGMLMQYNLSPIKLALTATEPSKQHELLINEGLFGPTIMKLTEKKGEDIGILAKATVQIIAVPYNPKINAKYNSYRDFYKYGIIKNKERNNLIINETIVSLSFNHAVLIIIENIDHGRIIKRMLKSKGIIAPFVRGPMDGELKKTTKENLKNGNLKVAICTKVWMEGINIPILRHIIYGAGLRDEKMVKQAMGRGLRTSEGKDKILLTDFLDPYPYISQHSIIRYLIYQKLGWLKR